MEVPSLPITTPIINIPHLPGGPKVVGSIPGGPKWWAQSGGPKVVGSILVGPKWCTNCSSGKKMAEFASIDFRAVTTKTQADPYSYLILDSLSALTFMFYHVSTDTGQL